ncbi:hypothetical protein [Parabacteroides leei]|uniref:hypothetical protein n=1 Tax=Parabacteroides leei TaxID=2939491 RepID=UPI00189ABE91|nr:hypothetical protein [Parabacteroides goldsteinii]
MNDFTTYRLNSYKEIIDIKERIGDHVFDLYLSKIYQDLLYLKKKSCYPLEKTWNEIDIVIKVKICCLFIYERKEGDYVMSNNYKLIIHN